MNVIAELPPSSVWSLFSQIAAVPRPSKREEQVRRWVLNVAAKCGRRADVDAAGNVCLRVTASPGREHAPPTILQAHLDMVCEADPGVTHDFDRDPISLQLTDEDGERIVKARGTTLGADNGMGAAMALAAATDPAVIHGPLEVLLTVDEEAGMGGARGLTPEFIRGRRLINLDSEEDHVLYIGCAGGCDLTLAWSLRLEPAPGGQAMSVTVAGLRGGHSGAEIHLKRSNAAKLLAGVLLEAAEPELRLISIEAGRMRNAIPRDASAQVIGSNGLAARLTAAAARMREAIRRDLDEPNAEIAAKPIAFVAPPKAASPEASRRLLAGLMVVPSGVMAIEPEIPGLVRTSNNLSTLSSRSEGDTLTVVAGCLARSPSLDQLERVRNQLAMTAELSGATLDAGSAYPGWSPRLDSPLLHAAQGVYERLFGAAPHVTAIHAGLECGIIGGRIPGMDMVSFGPTIRGAHSPQERVYVDSVAKTWKFLTALLAE